MKLLGFFKKLKIFRKLFSVKPRSEQYFEEPSKALFVEQYSNPTNFYKPEDIKLINIRLLNFFITEMKCHF